MKHAVVLFDAGSSEWSAADVAAVMRNVHEVRDVLRRRGWGTRLVPVRMGDFRWLGQVRRADLVFNLCEGINGHARYEDLVVGTLELTGVPITGCRAWPTTVSHRKHVANTLLAAAGVPVPPFVLAQGNRIPADFPLPAIVKPSAEDASVGVDQNAVCTNRKALRRRVAWLSEQFDEVLVQSYVAGREVNVGFVGSRMLPVSEISFASLPGDHWQIVSYAAKWQPDSAEYGGTEPVCPARLPADLQRRVAAVARQAWEHLAGAEGYGRVDLRIAEDGQPYVLEVNPCPDLSSDAGLARMAAAHGWSYDDLVMEIVEEALQRAQRGSAAAALAAPAGAAPATKEVPA